jgi:uncharacterized protein (DUF488 family)
VSLPFFTIGHSTRSREAFIDLLRAADIGLVADIRTIPKSRTNPQFNKDVLPGTLASAGIEYEHVPSLGGRRGRAKDVPPDLNGFWTKDSFHNYADYALSPAFRAGLDHLIGLGRVRRCAMMCSEAVWWRCHRRIVADHLMARGEDVLHLMGHGRVEPAGLTPGAVTRPDGSVIYPA